MAGRAASGGAVKKGWLWLVMKYWAMLVGLWIACYWTGRLLAWLVGL